MASVLSIESAGFSCIIGLLSDPGLARSNWGRVAWCVAGWRGRFELRVRCSELRTLPASWPATASWPVRLRAFYGTTGAASTSVLRQRRVRRRQRRQRMASLRGASSTSSAGLGVAWVSVVLCVCGAVWARYLWCVVVDSVVGGLVCGGWIGACICGNRNAGLGENGVGMVWACLYSWCINSK